jgi:hypothetical protein
MSSNVSRLKDTYQKYCIILNPFKKQSILTFKKKIFHLIEKLNPHPILLQDFEEEWDER